MVYYGLVGLAVVSRVAPVPHRLQIPQLQRLDTALTKLLQDSVLDDFLSDELLSAHW